MKRLIVSADDFAQNEAVDQGIVGLIADGRISAASCLSASPRWPQAARRLEREIRARADIGVHLDLTEFVRPAGSHAALIVACYAGTLDRGRLRVLIDEQLQRFEDALGTVPDYVDGHRHVHQLPRVRDVLLAALLARYATRLPWVRVSRASGAGAGLKARIVSGLGANEMAARCRAFGLASNERLLGFYDFARVQADHRPRLRAWLAQARTGDALMCHPAQRAEPDDPIGVARAAEFRAMQSPWWPEALAAEGIALTRGRFAGVGETI
ncbi:MAG TPA: ChbG/HpnK family deacetylase [Burkholderiaceae bacterium]|nr:ChbG/HpnK family deacetylase [Burkholderiaceae bacterium]